MNYLITKSSGTSSVAPGVGHNLLIFPASYGGAFVAFCRLLKLIPTYIPGCGGGGGSGFTLAGALSIDHISSCNYVIKAYPCCLSQFVTLYLPLQQLDLVLLFRVIDQSILTLLLSGESF